MFLANETLQAICRTFLHSLWQGVIAAALAGIILWATRHSSARTRYNLLGSLLLLTLLASGITFYTELRPTAAAIADITGTEIVTASAVLPSRPGEQVINYINTHADWFMLIWAIIFLVKCFRLAGGLYHIRQIRRVQVQPVPMAWQDTLKRLSHSLKIRKAVQLLESGIAKTPLTIGFFKPVIFLPLGLLTQLPADQVETILLHELAHIRRKDYFVNMLQSFTETIFFFNPAFLWISARLREEREACCDDIVVAHTPHKATYFHALVAFEEQTATGSSLQMGLGSTRNHLLHRVKRMLTRENKKLSLMERILLVFGLIAITAFSFMPEKEDPPFAPPVALHIIDWATPPPAGMPECLPVPQEDTMRMAKKDKWVTQPAPKKAKDKWVSEPLSSNREDKGNAIATDTVQFPEPGFKKKWLHSTDTVKFASITFKKKWLHTSDSVKFSSPAFKKKWLSSTDTVKFPKPVLKKKWISSDTVKFNPAFKKRITSTDTVLFKKPVFKEKKSPPSVTKENGVLFKKQGIELVPESVIAKKELSARIDKKPSASGVQIRKKKPATEIIKKEEAATQQGSKLFDGYLPEGLRQKKLPPGKDGC